LRYIIGIVSIAQRYLYLASYLISSATLIDALLKAINIQSKLMATL